MAAAAAVAVVAVVVVVVVVVVDALVADVAAGDAGSTVAPGCTSPLSSCSAVDLEGSPSGREWRKQ